MLGSDFSEAVVQILEANGWSRPEAVNLTITFLLFLEVTTAVNNLIFSRHVTATFRHSIILVNPICARHRENDLIHPHSPFGT
jgi:hypothetical protein